MSVDSCRLHTDTAAASAHSVHCRQQLVTGTEGSLELMAAVAARAGASSSTLLCIRWTARATRTSARTWTSAPCGESGDSLHQPSSIAAPRYSQGLVTALAPLQALRRGLGRRQAAEASGAAAAVHGPIPQADLLAALGIGVRLESLLQGCRGEGAAEALTTGYAR
jgi:hypothetical protein